MKRSCEFCGKEYDWVEDQPNWFRPGFDINNKSPKYAGFSSKRFCSYRCGVEYRQLHQDATCLKRYGKKGYNNRKLWKEKFAGLPKEKKKAIVKTREQTCLKKYGVKSTSQLTSVRNKYKQTCVKRYGVENPSKTEKVLQKMQQTNLKRYGVLNYAQSEQSKLRVKQYYADENNRKKACERNKLNRQNMSSEKREMHLQHIYNTKVKNNSFHISKPEECVYLLLKKFFGEVKRQYRSEVYPFSCDFYIPELDLYIEYQGTWMHGSKCEHPQYDPNNLDHQKILAEWVKKSKHSKQYRAAIRVWTIRDPLKRKTAEENRLNWLEFFTYQDIENWIQKQKRIHF